MIIDSHVHINDNAFIHDPEGYIQEAEEHGIKVFLCVGANLETSKQAVMLAEKYPNVYASVGIHPTDTKDAKESDLLEIEKLISNPKVIAVGEVGYDFHWEKKADSESRQTKWFLEFIALANKYQKPIIIHTREACDLTYTTLLNHPVKKGGIIHCYPSGKDYVERYVKLGYYFGIGGTVTFKNAWSVKEAVKYIPLDRLLLETDAPYLAPTPHRGEQNHSKYIPLVIEEISKIKNIDSKTIEDKTTENFMKLFGVKHF